MMRYRRLVVSAVEYHGLYHRWPYSYPIILTSVVCISDASVEWNFLFPLCVTDSLLPKNGFGGDHITRYSFILVQTHRNLLRF